MLDVQLSNLAGSGPSSRSVALPSDATCSPCSIVLPSSGDQINGRGAWFGVVNGASDSSNPGVYAVVCDNPEEGLFTAGQRAEVIQHEVVGRPADAKGPPGCAVVRAVKH